MRILCLPYTHTLSHISRPLAIAKELRQRGHDIIFAGDSPLDHFIREEGFELISTYQIPPTVLFERIRKGKLKFVLDDELDHMVSADRTLLNQVQPDLVLSDGRFSAPISTGIEQLNHVAVVNVSSTQYRALPYIPFFDYLYGSKGRRNSTLCQQMDVLNLFIEMLVFDNTVGSFKKLSHQHALRHKVTATNCLTGKDLTLLADIEEYFPARNLPDDYHYIGPLTWRSTLPAPAWWPPGKNGQLLVYFSMGTTWLGGSFSKLYELIRNHHITAIFATGGQASGKGADQLKTIQGQIYIEDFVDGDLMIKECDVVVCHGGNGTIYQALQHGKPTVGIPTIPDQAFNMRRVKALGVGETMALKELESNPEKLFLLINKVAHNPEYRENARKLKNILDKLKPAEKAADLIENYFCRA